LSKRQNGGKLNRINLASRFLLQVTGGLIESGTGYAGCVYESRFQHNKYRRRCVLQNTPRRIIMSKKLERLMTSLSEQISTSEPA
jgi:hypothetical protein